MGDIFSVLKYNEADEEWEMYFDPSDPESVAEHEAAFDSQPCISCGGTKGFHEDEDGKVVHWCGTSQEDPLNCFYCHSPITFNNPLNYDMDPEVKQNMAALDIGFGRFGQPCLTCYNRFKDDGLIPHNDMMEFEYGTRFNPKVHWRKTNNPVTDRPHPNSDFRASMDSPFEFVWDMVIKDFDFRPPHAMKSRGQIIPAFANYTTTPIPSKYEESRPFQPKRMVPDRKGGRVPGGFVSGGTREQHELYPEIFGDMPEGIRPRAPHYIKGTSRPRPIDEEGKKWIGVNLPTMGRLFNYEYGDERVDTDENLRYLAEILAHEHGHAAIDDELKELGRAGHLEHEYGAHTLQGESSEEVQESLRSRGLLPDKEE